MLIKAFEPRTRLTGREKKQHLGLCAFILKDDDLIHDLYRRNIKITVVCKDLDKLLEIYYNSDKGSEVRTFNVIIILSNEHMVLPLYPEMIGKEFGARTLCPVTVASEWYESSAKVNNALIKLHYMASKRETISPFRMPFSIASRFMDVSMVSDEIASDKIETTTKYLHLHDAARMPKMATSLSLGKPELWMDGVVFTFRVTGGRRQDANIPFFT